MTYLSQSTWPEALADADLVRIRFALDFLDACELETATLLGLRRPLRMAASQVLTGESADRQSRFRALFETLPSPDPVAVKKFQKPAPPFVIRPEVMEPTGYDAGDRLELEVLFIGTGVPLIGDFLAALVRLGQLGLVAGDGRYEVSEAYCLDATDTSRLVWRQDQSGKDLAPDLVSLDHWLERTLPSGNTVCLDLVTPVRILSAGKPLRRPTFAQLFPFLLRRVTAQLHAHCGIELVVDPEALLSSAGQVDNRRDLTWVDWRPMPGRQALPAVGGVTGSIALSGEAMRDLLWVLGLAALFGVGKGAAYGAGRLGLREA